MASSFSITRHFLQFSPTQKNQNLVQKRTEKISEYFPIKPGNTLIIIRAGIIINRQANGLRDRNEVLAQTKSF